MVVVVITTRGRCGHDKSSEKKGEGERGCQFQIVEYSTFNFQLQFQVRPGCLRTNPKYCTYQIPGRRRPWYVGTMVGSRSSFGRLQASTGKPIIVQLPVPSRRRHLRSSSSLIPLPVGLPWALAKFELRMHCNQVDSRPSSSSLRTSHFRVNHLFSVQKRCST